MEYAHSWVENLQGYPQYFPPGYGMFLAFADLVPFMDKGSAAALLQHAMMIATLLWIYRLLRHLMPSAVASLWLIVSSVLTPSLFLPQMIQSENLVVFTMAAAVYFAHGRSIVATLLGGLFLGSSVIAKVVPIVAAPALLLMQVAVRPPQRRTRMVAIFAGTALVIAFPILWFAAHGQAPVLTDSVGLHLYQRVQEQKIFDPSGVSTARVLTRLPGIQLQVIDPWDLREALLDSGLPMGEAHSLVGAVAQEGIRAHPADFLRYSFLVAQRIFFGDPCHFINWFARSPEPAPDLETPRPLPTTATGIDARLFLDWVFGRVWTVVCWLAVAGVMCLPLARDRGLAFTLAWIPAAYILTTGFVEVSLPRYNIAVTPFITATAFLPLGVMATRLGAPRRHDRRLPATTGP